VPAAFQWALKEGRIPDDPTLGVTREKVKTTGYKTWSEAEIERFEATHPIGTKARLAFALLLYTGQRRSDVVKMGRQDIHHDVLTVDQGKTDGGDEAHLEIPVHPKLREIINATLSAGIKTHFAKPYRPTILVLCPCVFNDLAAKLSNLIPRLDKRCSPSTLDELSHGFACHALAVGCFGIALRFAQGGMSCDRCDLVRRTSDLG
jgi:integrase